MIGLKIPNFGRHVQVVYFQTVELNYVGLTLVY